jgi:hypothetical protein
MASFTATSPERESIIRTAWKERGAKQWDPQVHGRGLAPLNIQASTDMQTTNAGQQPLLPYDNLEFRLGGTEIDGTPMTAIVCEGVVVESWPIQFM